MEGLSNYEKEIRPWGNFERFTLNEQCTVKVITVSANASLSLQNHQHRSEYWRILSGSGTVVIDEKVIEARTGEDFFIPQGAKHRIGGGPDGLQFLEIAFGTFDENDITRYEDNYGRT